MEDIIQEKLCNFCKNKYKNCKKIQRIYNKKIIIYKCENYKKDNAKTKGYTEKWIDNISTTLKIERYK